MNQRAVKKALTNWVTLNAALAKATEEDCETLLFEEQRGLSRLSLISRIHSRYNKLRAERERNELGIPPRRN